MMKTEIRSFRDRTVQRASTNQAACVFCDDLSEVECDTCLSKRMRPLIEKAEALLLSSYGGTGAMDEAESLGLVLEVLNMLGNGTGHCARCGSWAALPLSKQPAGLCVVCYDSQAERVSE
jgi:hypothetical protein